MTAVEWFEVEVACGCPETGSPVLSNMEYSMQILSSQSYGTVIGFAMTVFADDLPWQFVTLFLVDHPTEAGRHTLSALCKATGLTGFKNTGELDSIPFVGLFSTDAVDTTKLTLVAVRPMW